METTLNLARVQSLAIGERLTKLKFDGATILLKNAGAMTIDGDDATEGLHPADSDLAVEKIGASAQVDNQADAVKALIQMGYPGQQARDAVLTAAQQLGPDAGVEDLVKAAYRLPVKGLAAVDKFAVVERVILPANIRDLLDINEHLHAVLASGRQLVWSGGAKILQDGKIVPLADWPDLCASECRIGQNRYINCNVCGWISADKCAHHSQPKAPR